MTGNKLYILGIALFLSLLLSCSDSDNEQVAKNLFFVEHLAELSPSWEILPSSKNIVELNQKNRQGLRTGESIYFKFSKPKSIDYLEFISNDQIPFTYNVFLDNKYVGKGQTNKKVGIRKEVKAVRIVISKKGNELVVNGWDRDYDYTFVKDSVDDKDQKLHVKFSDQENVKLKKPVRKRNLKINSDLANNSFEFVDKHCLINLKAKRKDEIVEQFTDFKSDGTFSVSFVKGGKDPKKIMNSYFLHGLWNPVRLLRNKTEIELQGILHYQKNGESEYEVADYHKKILVDSLNIIRSNDLLNGVMLDLPNWVMVDLKNFNCDFIIDIPYATTNNITGQKLYECNECYLLYQTVKDLMRAQNIFRKKGFRIKLLDCYRPIDVQWVLYEAFPVSGYVADPIGGSIHNRGTAVDLTLVDSFGNELDMGTKFDDLTVRSNHGYIGFPDTILQNRKLLRETMNACNFVAIRLEWWHYNHQFARKYPKLNDRFPCNQSSRKD
jgi:D-alanyl-D-alanine dipeptidase